MFHNIFSKNKLLPVEIFGKLPFYTDYITMLSSIEANRWKVWLLDFMAKNEKRIPPGRWPFLFQFSEKSNVLAGFIEDSGDGIREFPFSIFCNFKKTKKFFNAGCLSEIRQQLELERNAIESVTSIEAFYQKMSGRQISIKRGKYPGKDGVTEFFSHNLPPCPALVILGPEGKGASPLVLGADTNKSLFWEQWAALYGKIKE